MKKWTRSLLAIFLITVLVSITGCGEQAKTSATPAPKSKPVTLTISAAASLTEAMGEIKTLYKKEKPNVTINYNFGSSVAPRQSISPSFAFAIGKHIS